ncbi:MAG: imidazolonepropionase [Muribaculaceae bacterium]|nr:imidazolonepropionase [Muribaculaceae bacterium]
MLITDIRLLAGLNPTGAIRLRGHEMNTLHTLADCWLRVDTQKGVIAGFGPMSALDGSTEPTVSARGGMVIPAFCDSHTHIIYSGSRDGEFLDKINGLSYEEIARRGGGILNSCDRLHNTSEQQLFEQSMERVSEVMAKGTGCIEIKSGYGLTTADELKMLRVAARIAEAVPATVRATFLGAHAVGRAFAGRQQEYVDMLCDDMLPAVAAEGLARFVDVFCDEGFFTPEQTDQILSEAARFGMRPKIHANELAVSGGVQVGVKHGALSVDHLERITEHEISLLASSDTAATMLPGASFFLGMPYAPALKAIDSGAIVALASDYNPGSSPSGDMRMVWALACSQMKLNPDVALNAMTINGAYAMDCSQDGFGSIAEGAPANFIITAPVPSLAFIPYAYTTPWIERVCLAGKFI